jgi:hypothetical protein
MILNLTQHAATATQIEAGVVDLDDERRTRLGRYLTVTGEVLRAEAALRDDLIRSQVGGISRLIWPELVQAMYARAVETVNSFDDGDKFAAWNTGREPLFQAMVGGAPYLVERLVESLARHGVQAVYALSERKSVETVNPDGSVTKTQVFEHVGFIDAL